jgi:hypothetical protein
MTVPQKKIHLNSKHLKEKLMSKIIEIQKILAKKNKILCMKIK